MGARVLNINMNTLSLSDKTVRTKIVDMLTACGMISGLYPSEEIVSHIQNDENSEFWFYLIDNFAVKTTLFDTSIIIDRFEEWDSLYSKLGKNVKKEVFAYISGQHPSKDESSMYTTYIFTMEDLIEFAGFYAEADKRGFVSYAIESPSPDDFS